MGDLSPQEHQPEANSLAAGAGASGLRAFLREIAAVALKLKQVTRSAGIQDAPGAGLGILELLNAHGPQTVPQLGRLRLTSRQNIQILVNRLAAEGYLELTHNPMHKRSPLVALSERGVLALAASAQYEGEWLAALSNQIPDNEMAAACRVLTDLRRLLTTQTREANGQGRKDSESGQEKHGASRKDMTASEDRFSDENRAGNELPINLL